MCILTTTDHCAFGGVGNGPLVAVEQSIEHTIAERGEPGNLEVGTNHVAIRYRLCHFPSGLDLRESLTARQTDNDTL